MTGKEFRSLYWEITDINAAIRQARWDNDDFAVWVLGIQRAKKLEAIKEYMGASASGVITLGNIEYRQ